MSGAKSNTIGGTTATARNVISGNSLEGVIIDGAGSNLNKIQGNYIGPKANGSAGLGNGGSGISISFGASNNQIGGSAAAPGAAPGNVIAGNGANGTVGGTAGILAHNAVGGPFNAGNIIEGNIIGLDATGAASPNYIGITLDQGTRTTRVGGTAVTSRNVISGNTFFGVEISNTDSSGNNVQGNFIGTNLSGTAAASNRVGVVISNNSTNNLIGGATLAAGNTIAFNTDAGVTIGTTASPNTVGNAVRLNSIHDNGGAGIDLNNDGVTPNDAGDADTGPNNLQNYPVITGVNPSGGNTVVSGHDQQRTGHLRH